MKNTATEIAIHTIGLDIAKNSFSIHGFDVNGVTVLTKDLKRPQVLGWFSKLPPCLVGLEACASAHYWARELMQLGHDVKLIPAQRVKAFLPRMKNDAADAHLQFNARLHGQFATLRCGLWALRVLISNRR